MKKLLILFLLSVTASFAQSTVTIPAEGTLASEQWVKDYVDQKFKDDRSSARVGNSGLNDCQAGPAIERVYNVTSTSAIVRFSGYQVYGITYLITKGGEVVRSGALVPTNDTPEIHFDALPPGGYTLSFFGNTCYGTSQKSFSIPKI